MDTGSRFRARSGGDRAPASPYGRPRPDRSRFPRLRPQLPCELRYCRSARMFASSAMRSRLYEGLGDRYRCRRRHKLSRLSVGLLLRVIGFGAVIVAVWAVAANQPVGIFRGASFRCSNAQALKSTKEVFCDIASSGTMRLSECRQNCAVERLVSLVRRPGHARIMHVPAAGRSRAVKSLRERRGRNIRTTLPVRQTEVPGSWARAATSHSGCRAGAVRAPKAAPRRAAWTAPVRTRQAS